MRTILYLQFIGLRIQYEVKLRKFNEDLPSVLVERNVVVDCNERAWLDGIRLGDTLRQAKISSPACQVVRVRELNLSDGFAPIKRVLDVLSKFSPYIEPLADGNGVFIDIGSGSMVVGILNSIGMDFYRVFAGQASSKLVAKASCDALSREFGKKGKIRPTKAPWGEVSLGEKWVLSCVQEGKERSFLASSGPESLWPSPPEILSTMRSLGIKTVRDIRGIPITDLLRHIGDWAFLIKEWADGQDRSPVKALYPPPRLARRIDFQEEVPLKEDLFEPAFKALAAELAVKEVGFKTMEISIFGDFPEIRLEKKFVRPIVSLNSMEVALSAMIAGLPKDYGVALSCPTVSGFAVTLSDIAPVQAKPISLIKDEFHGVKRAVPVALSLTMTGLERKFGGDSVSWGRSALFALESHNVKSEIIRREKMLSIWDPMRA